MRQLTREEQEQVHAEIQTEKIRQVQKRYSTKASLTALVILTGGGIGLIGHTGGSIGSILLVAALALLIAIWVYRDAKRRSMRALVWSLATFLFGPVALVLYLLETQEQPPVPTCHEPPTNER